MVNYMRGFTAPRLIHADGVHGRRPAYWMNVRPNTIHRGNRTCVFAPAVIPQLFRPAMHMTGHLPSTAAEPFKTPLFTQVWSPMRLSRNQASRGRPQLSLPYPEGFTLRDGVPFLEDGTQVEVNPPFSRCRKVKNNVGRSGQPSYCQYGGRTPPRCSCWSDSPAGTGRRMDKPLAPERLNKHLGRVWRTAK